jgi:uncharacterized membrane protein
MFSSGQKIFAILFMIIFLIIVTYQFYKDKKKNKTLFKGTFWILISILAIIIGYLLLTKLIY